MKNLKFKRVTALKQQVDSRSTAELYVAWYKAECERIVEEFGDVVNERTLCTPLEAHEPWEWLKQWSTFDRIIDDDGEDCTALFKDGSQCHWVAWEGEWKLDKD